MKEFIGKGSIKNLTQILRENSYKNAFYITGNSPLEQPNIKKVQSIIEKDTNFSHFDDIAPSPTIEGIIKA